MYSCATTFVLAPGKVWMAKYPIVSVYGPQLGLLYFTRITGMLALKINSLSLYRTFLKTSPSELALPMLYENDQSRHEIAPDSGNEAVGGLSGAARATADNRNRMVKKVFHMAFLRVVTDIHLLAIYL
jgi:hypothetical protein